MVCIYYLCDWFVNSVRNREPTSRPFTLESIATSQREHLARSEKKVASGSRNSASRAARKGNRRTTPANQVSSQPPGSQVMRSKLPLSSGAGGKEASKTANSSSVGHRSSAYSAVSSESGDGARHSAKSKAGFSAAYADSGTSESTSATGAGRNNASRTTATSSKSNSRDFNHHHSAANVLSSSDGERAERNAESWPEISAAETNLRATRSSSVTVPSDASETTPGNLETAGTGTGLLHHRAAESTRNGRNSSNKKVADSATGKSKDVNLGVNGVPCGREVHSSQLRPMDGTAIVSSATAENVSVANGISSSIDVSRHSVAPSSSEAMAREQASNVNDNVAGTASIDVITSGKTIAASHSNAAATRTRSVAQSSQTASSTQTASSAKASAANVSAAVNVGVVTSGKSTTASRSSAAASKTRSVTGGRQTPAAAVTASVARDVR